MDHPALNPAAPHYLPSFITAPGQSDWLMTMMAVFLLIAVVSVGLIYLKLHALPEHMAHRTSKVQYQFVAVLGLLALFTHNSVFWIAALLLALVELPNFSTPMNSIALSLEKLSGRDRQGDGVPPSEAEWDDLLSNDPPRPAPPPPSPADRSPADRSPVDPSPADPVRADLPSAALPPATPGKEA